VPKADTTGDFTRRIRPLCAETGKPPAVVHSLGAKGATSTTRAFARPQPVVHSDARAMLDAADVFTTRQALADGLNNRQLTDMVRSGVISRIGRGVYRQGSSPQLPDPDGLSRSMRAAISHASGAAWLGADLINPPNRLHLTAPRDRGRRVDCVDGVRLHRADVGPDELSVIRGALVTTPIRTVLDVARSMPLTEAVAIGDSLCRGGGFTLDQLRRAAAAVPVGPGRSAIQAAARLVDGRAESVFESITRVNLAIAGLPTPRTQFEVRAPDGRWVARVDFAWPEARVVLECDGYEFHSSREAFGRDRRRWNTLSELGWRVVVVTWRDVIDDPAYLVGLVSGALPLAG